MAEKQIAISELANTSVVDMKDNLWKYNDVEVLKAVWKVVIKRGEKTKTKMLLAKIRRLERTGVKA